MEVNNNTSAYVHVPNLTTDEVKARLAGVKMGYELQDGQLRVDDGPKATDFKVNGSITADSFFYKSMLDRDEVMKFARFYNENTNSTISPQNAYRYAENLLDSDFLLGLEVAGSTDVEVSRDISVTKKDQIITVTLVKWSNKFTLTFHIKN